VETKLVGSIRTKEFTAAAWIFPNETKTVQMKLEGLNADGMITKERLPLSIQEVLVKKEEYIVEIMSLPCTSLRMQAGTRLQHDLYYNLQYNF
jgi:hypothetical protein